MTDDDKALVERLCDEDSYYSLQEKHWCIDHVELESLRLAAAHRIEALSAENERLLDIDEVKANAIDSLLNDLASAEQENERLREALTLCAKHVDWMPHPHCVDVEATIRAALGDTK